MDYGPFVNIVAIALALIAMFSTLLVKMLGNVKKWTFLISDSPSFLVTAGPRMVAVAVMAFTYITITPTNYFWFGSIAVVIGLFGFWMVARFDHLRRLHIVKIPLVGENGQQLLDSKNNLCFENVVIGREDDLRLMAMNAFKKAKEERGVSLLEFMSGFGEKVNNTEALWTREILAETSTKLSLGLMFIVLSSVMDLYLAAFIVQIYSQQNLSVVQ